MNSAEILENSIKAFKLTEKHHGNITTLERALFLGWYCNLDDPCKFCFMSTQKEKIKDPLKARRKPESILAESILMKRIGWKLEFISGGYGYKTEELNDTIEMVSYIQQAKQYLNVGIIDFENLNLNNIEGVVGAVETVNPKLHEELCPGKPLSNTKEMLMKAKDMGLKTGITIILGMGETEKDIDLLLNLIEELNLDRITFYSLNPQDETVFQGKTSVTTLEYMNWVSTVRLNFPKMKIITGTWVDKLTNIGPLVMAGSNVITKFPLFSIYGKKEGKTVENEIASTGRELYSTFSDLDVLTGEKTLKNTKYVPEKIDISEKNLELINSLSKQLDKKIESYVKTTIRKSQK
ncbi:biotin synthase-like enzyme [Methanococcus maripaludis]|uniref:Biotin synthase-like enzyme n=1 Tax=Methanococcus maripaludis TaxID=39152 RepID=A0A7J9P916_METMI|nr:radical SAM protein [Methanococcus maripaludis]MBA2852054.1 biotin synthase-like enzyme [Methanococcus maripaludis]MBA2859196.1 biotin synthase-like enzyme [Methanococcus maripaludis]